MPTLLQLAQSYQNPESVNYRLAYLREQMEQQLLNLGDLAYEDQVQLAMLGDTIIEGGYLRTTLIRARSIFAEHLNVNALSAISADIGEVTSGIITGATIRTDSGNNRIELSSNLLRAYYAGVRRVQLDYDSLDFYTSDNRLGGEIVGTVDDIYNLPVLTMQANTGLTQVLSKKSATNYARIFAKAFHNTDDDLAIAGIEVEYGSDRADIQVGPGAIFLTGIHGSNEATLLISGSEGFVLYGNLDVIGNIKKIKTGTCNISVSAWRSFSFGETLPSVPRIVLTSADGVSGISNGKVRNVTQTGFEAILGGSGYSDSTHHYIAICGEG